MTEAHFSASCFPELPVALRRAALVDGGFVPPREVYQVDIDVPIDNGVRLFHSRVGFPSEGFCFHQTRTGLSTDTVTTAPESIDIVLPVQHGEVGQ